MTAHVISYREPRRKRGNAWAYAARRLGALALTVAALVFATWLAPYLRPAPPPKASSAPTIVATPLPPATLPEVNVSLDLAGGPAPARTRRTRAVTGVPLDAAADIVQDGFEVLSATELDAISQARD